MHSVTSRMKSHFSVSFCSLVSAVVLLGCLGCASRTQHPNPAVAVQVEVPKKARIHKTHQKLEPLPCPEFRREEVKQIAVVPNAPWLGKSDYNAVILDEFKRVLTEKGYPVVQKDLGAALRELKSATNTFITHEMAVRAAKAAGASHVVVIDVPSINIFEVSCKITLKCSVLEVNSSSVQCSWFQQRGITRLGGCVGSCVMGGPPVDLLRDLRRVTRKAAERLP